MSGPLCSVTLERARAIMSMCELEMQKVTCTPPIGAAEIWAACNTIVSLHAAIKMLNDAAKEPSDV
jgi:hypothetical protein